MKHISFVGVSTLSKTCLSRDRGYEAAMALLKIIGDSQIGVDLDTDGVVSLSFLDGLMLEIAKKGALSQVAFKTKRSDVRDKLARIAGARSLAILDASMIAIPPRYVEEVEPVFVNDKSQLESVTC